MLHIIMIFIRYLLNLDDNATNHWKKVAEVIDNGGWYANTPNDLFYSANCGRSKVYIILNAGPIAAFRSDNMIWDFKDLCIREIQSPTSNTVCISIAQLLKSLHG
jgi:hypothetical protein